ncbi:MAG: ABC transporter permease subunit [Pleurocapsa minor GSE-CHR-MK-17-07R]|jgi:phosphonate ABC transporter permease subunit PhnE|nr:ABC transporter permease subunit [Pleurocapsa minor GSE-CHR-MK 17-07R]
MTQANPSSPAPSRSRAALRRTLILIAVAIVLVIFAYGWQVTEINLERPQEPVRQTNVTNALRELLSPNVLTQDYATLAVSIPFQIDCPEGFETPPVTPPADGTPYIAVEPACASSSETVTLTGYNFASNVLARVTWIDGDEQRRIRQVDGQDNFTIGLNGTFSVSIEVPRIRGSAGELHALEVQQAVPSGVPRFTDTTREVLDKMVETIFLALIATAISILPSAILSFFAAHNLMRAVRMSLGNLLVMFTLLPLGFLVGGVLLSEVGGFVLRLASGQGGGVETTGLSLLVLGAAVAARRMPTSTLSFEARLRSAAMTLIGAVIVVALIGLIGGLGLLAGRTFTEGIPGVLGNFVGSLGRLIELSLPFIGGAIGAFALTNVGTALTIDALKTISPAVSRVIGGALGGLGGAIVLGMSATVGMSAAWLGLLTPVVAAIMGGAILPLLFRRVVMHGRRSTQSDRLLMSALGWIGTIAVFAFTFVQLNVFRAMVEGTLPPNDVALALPGLNISTYVLTAMGIGLVLGAVGGAIAGTRAAFPVGSVLYSMTRTILNGLRAIEPLIMGLVFVIWVGIGPFAGVLALTLHSIASLGKLYSEQIENIDTGPIEALESTGANRLQTIMYAVVPQIIPPYIAFTMYRWDINVRMSTIIGFVGGGGVGFLLQQQINLLRYRDAGVAVLAIAIVVSILDYASAAIRERYV